MTIKQKSDRLALLVWLHPQLDQLSSSAQFYSVYFTLLCCGRVLIRYERTSGINHWVGKGEDPHLNNFNYLLLFIQKI